ncbi:MAG: CusA/CzcA family heavy metal efflux RND transporter [Nannocystaceae bacterium]|nr:CusA/CzcA family heavy metal efflux RND transporter [Nannocystaceae bacterium]
MNAIARIVHGAVAHRVAVIVVVLVLAALAMVGVRKLQLDALPDITSNQVIVLTRAPGLTPEEVERLVTRRVETAVGGLSGVEEQRSLSRFGISSVTVVFDDDVDPWRARQQVQERIGNLAAELPAGVEPPQLGPFTGGLGEVFHLTLSSPLRSQAELLELAELRVAPLMRGVEGVVEANTWGGRRRALEVRADARRLAKHQVTLEQLRDALHRATGAAAGASIPAGGGQALLRGVVWPQGPVDLGAAIVRHGDPEGHERIVRVADVADVVWGDLPRIGAATGNGGGELVYVMLQMALHANALEVVGRIEARMDQLVSVLPEDVRVDVVYDRSDLVMATLRTVGKNLAEGAALVVVVLVALLGSLRAGIVVASVIPLSMLGAVAAMVLLGVPGNLMSLGAIDFGLLVDGAVVMVERAFHELPAIRERDEPTLRRTTIAEAMGHVAAPMTFSVAVIVLVYVPILALVGVDGKMFRPMALTVVFALLTALVLAIVWVPALSAAWLRPRHVPVRDPIMVRIVRRGYEPVLALAARAPLLVIVPAVALLAYGGVLYTQLGSAFVPQLDEGDLVIQATRNPDISLERAVSDGTHLERVVRAAAPEVEAIVSRIGSPAVATDIMGLEMSDVFVELAPRERWRPGLQKDALIAQIEQAIATQAPGASAGFTQPIQMRFNELLGGAVTDVTVEIYGEDLAALYATAERVRAIVAEADGAHDVRIMAPPSVPVLDVRPRLLDAAQLGIDAAQVLDLVRAVRAGVDVGTTWDGPVQIPIRLRVGSDATAASLAAMQVVTPAGSIVPLSRLADVSMSPTPALVNRHDAQRRVVVGFNVRGRSLGEVVTDARSRLEAADAIPRGQRVHYGGQFETLEEARSRMAVVVPIVMVGIILVLVALFRAAGPALLIFLNVPFAGVGGVIALASRDMPMSISAAVGFIALSGIAVLNGVVLISGIRALQREGHDAASAAMTAARQRVRPVVMTALVAALGFIPMAVATGVGAEVQRPLATVVVGGLGTSTLLTLVVLPALYHLRARWFGARRPTAETSP